MIVVNVNLVKVIGCMSGGKSPDIHTHFHLYIGDIGPVLIVVGVTDIVINIAVIVVHVVLILSLLLI